MSISAYQHMEISTYQHTTVEKAQTPPWKKLRPHRGKSSDPAVEKAQTPPWKKFTTHRGKSSDLQSCGLDRHHHMAAHQSVEVQHDAAPRGWQRIISLPDLCAALQRPHDLDVFLAPSSLGDDDPRRSMLAEDEPFSVK